MLVGNVRLPVISEPRVLIGGQVIGIFYFLALIVKHSVNKMKNQCQCCKIISIHDGIHLHDGSVSSEALGEGMAWQPNPECAWCKAKGFKLNIEDVPRLQCYTARDDAAHGLCGHVPPVAWLLRSGRAGAGKAPVSITLLNNCLWPSSVYVRLLSYNGFS